MSTVRKVFLPLLLFPALALAQQISPARVETGNELPALSGVDLQGAPMELSQYKGVSTLVLSFWSIHCLDCIRELDDLRSIRQEFPQEEVTVVAVNTDSGLPVERIAGFVRRYEGARGSLGVVHLVDRNAAIVDALGIRYVPVLMVVDRSGRISSMLTGYSPDDRSRMAQAMEEGRVTLGAWSEGLRGRLRTILRGPAAGGRQVEWGSFRVEDGMSLFGIHDSVGWLADAAGRRDRELEARRVEETVADRLKVALLDEALASVGVRLPSPLRQPFHAGGVEIPESPLASDGGWKRLYEALRFDELYRSEGSSGTWVADEYWAGLVGDVDLGLLKERLEALGYPREAGRIRLEIASDFDYKPRALLKALSRTSSRLKVIQGEHVVYYGDAGRLADELRGARDLPFQVFVEVIDAGTLRVEIL